jgi:hypothetical protein
MKSCSRNDGTTQQSAPKTWHRDAQSSSKAMENRAYPLALSRDESCCLAVLLSDAHPRTATLLTLERARKRGQQRPRLDLHCCRASRFDGPELGRSQT